MGIMGIKIAARGRLSTWTRPRIQRTAPLLGSCSHSPGTLNLRDAMRYVVSLPVSKVILGCDNIVQLEENVQIARESTSMSQAQMAALSNVAGPRCKTSPFQSTSKPAPGPSI